MLGEASATLVGLLFVAASVGSRRFSGSRSAALRIFLSASVLLVGIHNAWDITVWSISRSPDPPKDS